MLTLDEHVRVLYPELREELRIRAVAVGAAEHERTPAGREVGVVAAECGPMAGVDELVVPVEPDERVSPVEQNRFEHGGLG